MARQLNDMEKAEVIAIALGYVKPSSNVYTYDAYKKAKELGINPDPIVPYLKERPRKRKWKMKNGNWVRN